MTGLIRKDFLVMRKALKSYLLLVGFYIFLAYLDLFDYSFIITFVAWSSSRINRKNSSKISSRTTGSSPAVASSSMSSLGRWARAADSKLY